MLNRMRSYLSHGLILALLVAMLLTAAAFAQQQFDAAGEKQLVELINQERAREGLAPLGVDERLTQAARKHTVLLVKHAGLSHQFVEEQPLQARFADERLRSDRQAENVALEMEVAGAHAVLMNSPPHRANILSPKYNALGVGVMLSGDRVYVTEDFAHRLPDYSDAQADEVLLQTINQYAGSMGMPAPMRKPQSAIRNMACDMAVIDALDTGTPRSIVGVHRVMAWTATELDQLPESVKAAIAQPLKNGYSLGVCFAASPTHPGGMYWIVMVAY
ncbi:MAG: CAP domain-containing protein [Candidatus Korobacteraceae bacterium]